MLEIDSTVNPVDVSLALAFLHTPVFNEYLMAQREYEIEYQNGNDLYETRTSLVDAACGVREMERHEVNDLLHKLLMQSRDEGKAYGRLCETKQRMWDVLFESVCEYNDSLDADSNDAQLATYCEVKNVVQNIANAFGCSLY